MNFNLAVVPVTDKDGNETHALVACECDEHIGGIVNKIVIAREANTKTNPYARNDLLWLMHRVNELLMLWVEAGHARDADSYTK